ncbi:ankyrin repeat-containing protein ITN1-like [Cornus florida]|uniref:ankyrin repeat-containing protein ITN1-like n=1 Tax=Cornus florida TaxID=4283 RepID=UPI00289D0252|nr:ankyrin repeat-containing protein ITN1-like [Cornus florida]
MYDSKFNIGRKTPAMIFSETHEDLMKEGEKWLKDTTNSCTIVAALIVTIVFAAVITVPGGSDGKSDLPILSRDKAFIIFMISDALALFSSASSLLMFLSILTSRYAKIDFLYTLPKRLICGLITLFVAMVSMMVAFGATLHLIFGQKTT